MRIMVFGDYASGKSTFSIKLGKKLNIPVIHLDRASELIGRGKNKEIAAFIRKEAERELGDRWKRLLERSGLQN